MVIVSARESETRKSSPTVADLMLRAKALGLKPASLKNLQQMEDLYRQALALEPNNASAMAGLASGLVFQANGFLDGSVKESKENEGRDLALKAKALDPDNAKVYGVIGTYAYDHGDFAGARRAAETRLSLEPKDPAAYAALAILFRDEGEPKRAIELLNQTISLNPKHPHEFALLMMGSAYFMLGDNDAAIEWLLKSVEKNPEISFTYAFLAMAYALKGEDAEARAAAAEARRIEPSIALSEWRRAVSSNPAKYQEWFESKAVPAWRKAGLPE